MKNMYKFDIIYDTYIIREQLRLLLRKNIEKINKAHKANALTYNLF